MTDEPLSRDEFGLDDECRAAARFAERPHALLPRETLLALVREWGDRPPLVETLGEQP